MSSQSVELILPKEELELLSELAKRERKSLSDVTSLAVSMWLKKERELFKAREKMRTLGDGIFDGPEDLASNHDDYLYRKG